LSARDVLPILAAMQNSKLLLLGACGAILTGLTGCKQSGGAAGDSIVVGEVAALTGGTATGLTIFGVTGGATLALLLRTTGLACGFATGLACAVDFFFAGALLPLAPAFFAPGLAAGLRAAGRVEPPALVELPSLDAGFAFPVADFALGLLDLGCALRTLFEGFLAMVILDRRAPARAPFRRSRWLLG